ncbi:histidine phosphatase family protein [Marinicaulis aureus]|uniref:Histidine phosphatase family protein n=1 Tax=Hyphococcus aureus TaxID=2666033 RepID=A0ABW1KW29_9PROT
MLRFLCAAFAAAFLASCATGPVVRENEAAASVAFEALKRGGYVIVMRHANSPGGQVGAVGLSEGCKLAPGRGLDAEGFFQARAMGEILKQNGVKIAKAYTSPMCRSWDTAALSAAGAPVEPHPSQISEKAVDVAAMKAKVAKELAANPGTNIILSSHSNIAPLYGATVRRGEDEVPSGVIWLVHPGDWQAIARVDLLVRYPKVSPAVE